MESSRCRAFITAAETGSFSKAAEILNYTPSGVSQLVTALENELGFKLLRRSRRGVSVTQNGERMIPLIKEFVIKEKQHTRNGGGNQRLDYRECHGCGIFQHICQLAGGGDKKFSGRIIPMWK